MPILVDIIMIGLLVGVIIHSIRLSKSLTNFKSLHAEMLPMMKDYAKTLIETQVQINELKKVSEEVDHIISSRIPPALCIKNDLDFLVSRANEMADHLESLFAKGRQKEFAFVKEPISIPKQEKKVKPLKTETDSVMLKAPKEDKVEPPVQEKATLKKTAIESFFSKLPVSKTVTKGRHYAA